MDDLTDFVASTLEFIVSGVLFTAAAVFVGVSWAGAPNITADEMAWLKATPSLVIIGVVAFAYAAGVLAESFARAIFEPWLDRITVRRTEFQEAPLDAESKESKTETEDEASVDAPLGAEIRESGTETSKAVIVGMAAERDLKTRWKEWTLGDGFTAQDCADRCKGREQQRTVVMTLHPAVFAEVQSQLTRLRLERVFALSSGLVVIAFLFQREFVYASVSTIGASVVVWAVKARLDRYCGAISRGFKISTHRAIMDRANELSAARECGP